MTVVANPSADGTLTSNATVSSNVSDPDGADNAVTVYAADGRSWAIERQPKPAVARQLIDLIAQFKGADAT